MGGGARPRSWADVTVAGGIEDGCPARTRAGFEAVMRLRRGPRGGWELAHYERWDARPQPRRNEADERLRAAVATYACRRLARWAARSGEELLRVAEERYRRRQVLAMERVVADLEAEVRLAEGRLSEARRMLSELAADRLAPA